MHYKFLPIAAVAAFVYGQVFLGLFLFLSVMSLFGTQRPFYFLSLFLFTGIAYGVAAYGLWKKYKAIAFLGAVIPLAASFLLVELNEFSTGRAAALFEIIIRIAFCLPLTVLIWMGRREIAEQ